MSVAYINPLFIVIWFQFKERGHGNVQVKINIRIHLFQPDDVHRQRNQHIFFEANVLDTANLARNFLIDTEISFCIH